jgi:hypothetical protein
VKKLNFNKPPKLDKPKQFAFLNTPKGMTKLKFGKGLGVKAPSVRVKG